MLDKTRYEDWGLTGFSESEIQTACVLFERQTGIDPKFNPSGTGVRYMRRLAAKAGRLDRIEPPASGTKPFTENLRGALPIVWIDHGGTERNWLLGFDKRASYLMACDAYLGVGDWMNASAYDWRCWTSEDWRAEKPNNAGLWHLRFPNDDLAPYREFVGAREWFYTPMVNALAGLGCEFTVQEGYVYPRSLQLLKDWRKRLLDALTASEDLGNRAMRKMVKSMYTKSIGLLGSTAFAGDTLYRPDWRGQIVDQSAARCLWNVHAFQTSKEEIGEFDLMCVYDDCLYIAADLPYQIGPFARKMESAGLTKTYRTKEIYRLGRDTDKLWKMTAGRFSMNVKNYIYTGDVNARVLDLEGINGESKR